MQSDNESDHLRRDIIAFLKNAIILLRFKVTPVGARTGGGRRPAAAPRARRSGATTHHRDLLRFGRVDQPRDHARRRGLARSCRSLSLDDAAKAIGEYRGRLAKRLGDGFVALFGYPRARENDAARAGGFPATSWRPRRCDDDLHELARARFRSLGLQRWLNSP